MFRRKSTEVVGRFRVFDVECHQMVTIENDASHTAHTLRCPDWASIVPVTRAGEIVMVRQYRHGIDAHTLEVPGGVVDAGEDARHAAIREMAEESGYGSTDVRPLGVSHPNPPLQSNRHFTFLALNAEPCHAVSFDHGEHCELVLVPIAEVRRMLHADEISHALVQLALWRAFDALDSCGYAAPTLDSAPPRPVSRSRSLLLKEVHDEMLALLTPMEELQAKKVIELARRLHPHVTAEDIRNPHDFPELDDIDWHFADGQLAGIQSVISAIRALEKPPAPVGT